MLLTEGWVHPPVYVSPDSPPTYFGSQIWGTVRYASFLKIFQKKNYKIFTDPFLKIFPEKKIVNFQKVSLFRTLLSI